MLLIQRAFWVGTTDDPDGDRGRRTCPTDLWHAAPASRSWPAVVLLGIGQLVFSRLENKIPERL